MPQQWQKSKTRAQAASPTNFESFLTMTAYLRPVPSRSPCTTHRGLAQIRVTPGDQMSRNRQELSARFLAALNFAI